MSNLSREPRRLLSKQRQRYERSQRRHRQPEIRSVNWESAAVLGLLLLLPTLASLSLAVLSFVDLLAGDMCLVIGELLALRHCSVLQLGAWRKLCSRNKDLTQLRPLFFDSEHFKRPCIYRVVMLGPFRRPVDLFLASSSTADDALRELRRRRLIPHLQRITITVLHRGKPVRTSERLDELGIGDLSTLHVRYAVCGGSHWQGSNLASASGTEDAGPSSDSAMDVDNGDSLDNNVWTYLPELDRYSCNVCPGSIMKWKRIQEHERAEKHQRALERLAQRQTDSTFAPADASSSVQAPAPVTAAVRGSLQNILQQLKDGASAEDTWVNPETGVVDWSSSAMMDVDTTMHESLDARQKAFLAARLEEFLNEQTVEVGSDDEDAERSDGESSTESHDPLPFLPGRKSRKVNLEAEKSEWFPWPDRETCVLDVLRHIPRCSFSKKQNAAIHWAIQVLGLENLPSDRVMNEIDKQLQPMCGIQSIRYSGKLGHVYYVNDFAAIIAQEMANPSVRKHLRFLPEDKGSKLAEAWQATRWLDELDSDLTTPMHRIGLQDFYVHEPAILRSGDTCIPTWWFERDGQVYARVWRMQQVMDRNGWVVDTSRTHDVSAAQFLVAFPAFIAIHEQRNLADPRLISGVSSAPNTELSPWSHTNPLYGNRWRSRANGHRVVAFPVWLYCDDTSGNQSKKWNKHNSFLFTAAGLPRRLVHLESNIHFLATSNIAPPLEMLDGIVDQLCSAQARGIWAWDSVLNEIVLVIPSVLAMLGDNPMQSEFACHIGFRGKFFCRVCKVQGDPADDEDEEDGGGSDAASNSSASSVGSMELGTKKKGAPKKKKTAKSRQSVAEMVSRIMQFMKRGPARNRQYTCDELKSQFATAMVVGGKTEPLRAPSMFSTTAPITHAGFHARQTRQEREVTKEKVLEVAHRSSPGQVNWLLNTHQMRDAAALMAFRAKPAALDRAQVVQSAAEVEFAARQTKTAAAAAKAASTTNSNVSESTLVPGPSVAALPANPRVVPAPRAPPRPSGLSGILASANAGALFGGTSNAR
ncbi:hypothetical protein HMN09_00978100 [Mycena chlorophos]|uniref:C2H2-type domain-containing protein n=1 Tax=Mycena chlorophos TaxID=658473 RepID=A0A8H6SIR5_MYCCL|nr:hypothetical protein HMN09_00978100 [Mycena chlorophos]